MARYTVLRLLIFFGFLLLFWLVGLRDNRVLLLGAAALASAAASYLLLRGMRDEMTAKLVERHEARLAAKQEPREPGTDELAEDAEIDDAEIDDAPAARLRAEQPGRSADQDL